MAGYSGTPLAKKLGIRSGTRVRSENAPADYGSLIADAIRRAALPLGLVDVKACAVGDIWSGLKPLIRKELR